MRITHGFCCIFDKFNQGNKMMAGSIGLIVDQFVKRFWYFLCAVPLLFQMAFHIINNGKLELEHVYWDAVLILILTFLSMLIMVWRHKYFARWLPWMVAAITILVSISVGLQSDRDLSWPGSDVAIGNYRAALIALDEGPFELISTWNARANPYVEPNYLCNPQKLVQRIDRLGLGWFVGSRWDRRDLPQDNNRMHQHPPGGPVVLSFWLKLFGTSHFAATAYALFIRYCLIVITIFWARRYIPTGETLNRMAIAFLLATAPRVLSVIIPHTNELATLLALGAVIIGTSESINRRFIAYLLSGMLLTGAAYINFCFVIVGLTVTGALILSKEAWREKLPVAFVIGEVIVVIFFMILGYYPWLTCLTGTQATYYYNLAQNRNLLLAVAGFIAISIPLLLITFLSLGQLAKMRGSITHIWMATCIIALVVYSYVISPNPPSRYLIGMFFLLIPLLSLTIRELQLSIYQVMMIPATNFIYMVQAVFFK
jgi:hypothetical protein